MIYRHGDVILRQIEKLPGRHDVINNKPSCVLAEGETTGHKHLLTASEGNVLLIESHGERFLQLDRPATLTHEEHKTIQVNIGIYEILQEREFDYLEHTTVPVID
jgi:hypothetical protein